MSARSSWNSRLSCGSLLVKVLILQAKFVHGLKLTKFGRNSVAKRRIFVLNIDERTFTWKVGV